MLDIDARAACLGVRHVCASRLAAEQTPPEARSEPFTATCSE